MTSYSILSIDVLMSDNDPATLLLGRSRTRQRILALLTDDPGRRIHLRALARSVGASAGTVARELNRLEGAGLVRGTREGGQVYYTARWDSPLMEPIREIARMTIGAPDVIRRALSDIQKVEQVMIFGSYARGDMRVNSDIDLLVVGSPDRDDLTDRLEAAGREIGRPVNEVVMAAAEWARREVAGDKFIESIVAGPTVQVYP